MTETENTADDHVELSHTIHSPPALLKATILAAVLAIVVLISVVLPAEYGIDPTGVGTVIGLTALTRAEVITDADELATTSRKVGYQEDSVNISVPAGAGLEYKFHLVKGETMRYEWSSNDGELYFDFHGEPAGDMTGYFESYTVGTGASIRGTFTASFDGSHGWYWENKTPSPIVVALNTQGTYDVIGLK
jgi:hypothetical protein